MYVNLLRETCVRTISLRKGADLVLRGSQRFAEKGRANLFKELDGLDLAYPE